MFFLTFVPSSKKCPNSLKLNFQPKMKTLNKDSDLKKIENDTEGKILSEIKLSLQPILMDP